MAAHLLTDAKVKNAKPKADSKAYKLTDGNGLYLLVQTNGTKCWRYDYRFGGKRKTLALGTYPPVRLKDAREALAEAKRQLSDGRDPGQEKKRKRVESVVTETNRFSLLARDWWEQQKGTWTKDHADRVWSRLEIDVIPHIGHLPITEIKPYEIIEIIRRIEGRGSLEVASRVQQDIRRICRYAVHMGRLTINPAGDLGGVLKSRRRSHRPALGRAELPEFLSLLETYETRGRLLTKFAIKLLVLTFVRSGELRGARWEELDLPGAVWRIPAARMKMGTAHIVPLSRQAIEAIESVRKISGHCALLFPSERRPNECMSDNTMRRAIFKMGYDGNTPGKSKAVPHGFRATASSILNEEGFTPDAVERQLSHQERSGVRAAYTHQAEYLQERARMMQWWADYLDANKPGGEGAPI